MAFALIVPTDAMAQGDVSGAGALYGQILQQQPDNVKAIAGMAKCYAETGQPDSALQLLDTVPEANRDDPDVSAVRASLELMEKAQEAAGRSGEFETRLEANPNDHEARYELALVAYAQQQNERAIDELLEIFRRDRAWNEEAARKELVKIFEALGNEHPATLEGRQQLSSMLFS